MVERYYGITGAAIAVNTFEGGITMINYFRNCFRNLWHREEGMGTVEIVIIIAVLVGLALIFRNSILDFSKSVMNALFANDQIKNDVDVYNM